MRDGERAGGWQVIHIFAAVAFAGGVVLGLFDLIGGLLLTDQDTGARGRLPGWPSVLFDVVWVVLAWRVMRMGVYASASGGKGLRIRTVPWTVTYPWAEIGTAEARGNDLWLVLAGGRAVKTPVCRIEGRPARRGRAGLALDPGDFNVLLHQVQGHLTL